MFAKQLSLFASFVCRNTQQWRDLGFVGLGNKQTKSTSEAGFEPATFSLGGRRAIHCATQTGSSNAANTRNNVAQSKGGESSPQLHGANSFLTPWRNGNASDSRPEDWGFDSLWGRDEKKSLGCRRDHLRHPQKRAKMAESICSLRQSVKNEPGT